MIRLEGAEVLCDSIRTNRTLTDLDLSFNALGRSAAEVLGSALIQNNVSGDVVCYVCVFASGKVNDRWIKLYVIGCLTNKGVWCYFY